MFTCSKHGIINKHPDSHRCPYCAAENQGTHPTVNQQAIPAETLREIAACVNGLEAIKTVTMLDKITLVDITERLRQLLVLP